ncbi:glycerophosphodiester phosphodiesterase [Streptomyces sp. HNM0663]|uniref:Glycerophosphodiester phosphodiesterase n=1 Tax=Streptomyces chengmaiensis TaxID=3040919 RepID=A0ABT6HRJ2_9ACTN|nr:glycerophosphodiester phosphodiesterase [Streptomyces chengmaiensis]MDH2391332.1 glycerophosphodiester phosphodiesterase [Streptomyces chengmaiensis]
MRPVTAVAHRGDPYRVRENTLGSLRSAIERGADAVEIDVRLTGDEMPVLLHDASLKRLWGHDRPLDRLTLAQLKELTLGGVPTLAEALLATGDHRLMVDLPGASERSVRAIVGMVREYGAAERVYYSAGPAAMLAVRAADPSAEIALTWTTLAPPRPVLLAAVGPRWLNYRFGLVSRDLADRVHRDGCLVSAWTADTRRTMRRLVAHGVDSITTNRVDVLDAVLSSHR